MNAKWQPAYLPYVLPRWTPPPYVHTPPPGEPPPYDGGPTIDVTPQSVVYEPTAPVIQKTSLDAVPVMQHSRIYLADYVRHKVAPPAPISLPYVDHMHWHFDEPRDESDHEVRLYAVLSQEERALVRRWGLQHHAFEQETLFDDEALERLQTDQSLELASAPDPQLKASLAIEHKQQLAMAREAKIDITIEDYLSYPYCKQFGNRYQATNGQRKFNKIMTDIRKMLEDYNAR
jgi:hypothetical protein